MEQFDITAIKRKNPNVDRDSELLDQALAAIRELEKIGIKSKQYALAPPSQRWRENETMPTVIHTPD